MDLYNERSEYVKLLQKRNISEELIEEAIAEAYRKSMTQESNYDPTRPDAKAFRILFVLGRASNYARKWGRQDHELPTNWEGIIEWPVYEELNVDKVLSLFDISESRRKHFKAVLDHGFVEAAKITGSKYATVKKDYEIVRQILRDNKGRYL